MNIIDYYYQELPMADLVDVNGVKISEKQISDLIQDLKYARALGDCPKKEINFGSWILIIEGLDEFCLLIDALERGRG